MKNSVNFNWEYHWLNKDGSDILMKYDNILWETFCKANKDILYTDNLFEIEEKLKIWHITQKDKLIEQCNDCIAKWTDVNKLWISLLENIFQTVFEKDCMFDAYLTRLPIYPRDIATRSFLIPIDVSKQQLVSIVAHEVSHFYYYKKLSEVNGNSYILKKKHKYWIISELLVPLLFELNESKKIMGDLLCSKYLFKEELIDMVRPVFYCYLSKNSCFADFISTLLNMTFPEHLLNKKYLMCEEIKL